jgi:hypothetical protein
MSIEAPKPLDDQRLQGLFSDAISGALAFGAQNTNPPPAGHWLERFWQMGRAERALSEAPPAAEPVAVYQVRNPGDTDTWQDVTKARFDRFNAEPGFVVRLLYTAPQEAALWNAYAEGRDDERKDGPATDVVLREIWRALLANGNHAQAAQVRRAAVALRAAAPAVPQTEPADLHDKMERLYAEQAEELSAGGMRQRNAALALMRAVRASPQTEKDAARDVLAERKRQVDAEGWTPEHDDEHGGKQMAHAAACYALGSQGWLQRGVKFWPWDDQWWKPRDHRSNCVRAAALLLAEIERLDRAAMATEQPK